MSFSAWTVKTGEQTARELGASLERGLSDNEAGKRRERYGANELMAHEPRAVEIFFRQFRSSFVILLVIAAGIAFLLADFIESALILFFVLLNASLGFFQEFHSERSLALLKKYFRTTARVRRDGADRLIAGAELVPGDVVTLAAGDRIPADVRLTDLHGLLVDESTHTGESAPVAKRADPLSSPASEIPQAANMGFSGTVVVGGWALGIVVATGAQTSMGTWSRLTAETERVSTFEKSLERFSRFLLQLIVVILVVVYFANLLIKGRAANPLELAVFTIALAVSVIPEALPAVTAISLSRGALLLARRHVVVKRLSAIEDLGSIDVLCTDKTGTLTENRLRLDEIRARDRDACISNAILASSFLGERRHHPGNAFDVALWESLDEARQKEARGWKRLEERPFDPVGRRNAVLVERRGERRVIVRGAPEAIRALCGNGAHDAVWIAEQGRNGRRVISIAWKSVPVSTTAIDERDLQYLGSIAFEDPLKPTTVHALREAKRLGVQVKILSGDAPEVVTAVARQVGLIGAGDNAVTGDDWERLPEDERRKTALMLNAFARVTPEQKFLIIQALETKYETGFLGEGVNDAPGLKAANVGLVVKDASDVARDAADVVLLNRSLDVIVNGIAEGRSVFANTTKYILTTLASNFGNFYAVASASLLLNYLPMLPIQILLLNLLSDLPMVSISTDRVDRSELLRPRHRNVRELIVFATLLGLVSTIFDFAFFALYRPFGREILQTNWFIGSVLTELALIYSARSRLPFFRALRPSWPVVTLTAGAAAAAVILPYTQSGMEIFHFHAPTSRHLAQIIGVVILYFAATETVKLLFQKFGRPHQETVRALPQ